MKTRNKNPITYLLLDNNVLSRALDRGIAKSLEQIGRELLSRSGRPLQPNVSRIIIGPAGFFELAGLNRDEFVTPQELRELLASIDESLDPEEYIETLFKTIEARVDQIEALALEPFIQKFIDKLPYLPKDSQEFVTECFIKPLRSRPEMIKVIRECLSFHLLCSCAVPPKHVSAQHIFGLRLAWAHFKAGRIISVAKHLPRIWQRMRSTGRFKSMPEVHKNELAESISMHSTGDYLDSDLIHLAVAGHRQGEKLREVYCVTEDNPNHLRHRVLLYKNLMRSLAQSYRDRDERVGEREYKDLDFKDGRVFIVDKDLNVIDEFNVQKLKQAPLYTPIPNREPSLQERKTENTNYSPDTSASAEK